MESITIEFDDATMKVERDRPLEDMSEEDVYWCFGADITLSDGASKLYIEAPLFYFTAKVLELASLTPPVERTIVDYYDSYRLQVTYKDAEVLIFDEYGGGKVKFAFKQLFRIYEQVFQDAVDKLIANNQALHECRSFMNVLRKVSERLKSCKAFDNGS